MEYFKGEFYGPALLSVHHLESKKANWPRILLGPGLIDLWKALPLSPVKNRIDRANINLVNLHKTLSFIDKDGFHALDYLGEKMLSLIKDVVDEIIDPSHLQVINHLNKYSSDKKIKKKYENLLQYYQSRLGILDNGKKRRAEEYIEKYDLGLK